MTLPWSSVVFLILGSILASPIFLTIGLIAYLSTCELSLVLRKKYVDRLLIIFEYGRKQIEEEQHRQAENEHDNDANATNHMNGSVSGEVLTNNQAIIKSSAVCKDDLVLVPNVEEPKGWNLPRNRSLNTLKREFRLVDCLDYVKAGVEAIIEDEVTQRFIAAELKSWNLLTRTNRQYEFINVRLTVVWIMGFIVRYFLLLPFRVITCFLGVVLLTVCTTIIGFLPEGDLKRSVYEKVSIGCFNYLSCTLTSVIKFHNRENIPKTGICVANHTSPIDVMVLHCDNAYALIGQRHGGFLSIFQRALGRASSHIWFERSEVKDREAVAKRWFLFKILLVLQVFPLDKQSFSRDIKLKQHVDDPDKLPILIFPEGTCINNTSVMQFKKGSFEVGSVIYPVAIKYDPRFTDAFWNSSQHSMIQYLYMMMTSWALVCDVWYLPPMTRREGESAIDFANRVKAVIAKQGGLVDLAWDGQLKRMKAKKEWKQKQQEEFSKRFKVE